MDARVMTVGGGGGRVIAGGGGDAAASYAGHAVFASWLGHEPGVLYLPFAMGWEPEVLQKADAWMRSTFEPLGISRITTCFTRATLEMLDLDRYDGIYMGGGNSYLLISLLRESGAAEGLRRALAAGRPLYGGSAGAVCLGKTVTTAAHLDENLVGIADLRGLDVMAGHAVWPHYQDQELEEVRAAVRTTGVPMFAVPESGAVVRERGSVWSVGSPVYLIRGDGEVARLPACVPERRAASAEGGTHQ